MKRGKVTLSTYWQYCTAGNRSIGIAALICGYFITQALSTGSEYWLNIWTDSEQRRIALSIFPSNKTSQTWTVDTYTGIWIYSILIGGFIVFFMICTVSLSTMCTASSIALHDRMLRSVTRAPLNFFNRNPIGYFIINDLYVL